MQRAKRRLWTQEEISALKELYPKGMKEELVKRFGRSWKAICHKGGKLGLLTPIGAKRLMAKRPSKEKLEKLYRDVGPKRAAEILGVNSTTIWRWIKKTGIELRTPVKKVNINPSPDLMYVLGVLKGDGYVRWSKKSYKYFVELRTISKEFAESFASSLSKIGLTPALQKYRSSSSSFGKNPIYSAMAYSKKFAGWYKDLHLEQIRKMIRNNKEFAAAFIRGFYESEGSFYISRKRCREYPAIYIGNTDLPLLLFVRDLISLLGYSVNLNKARPTSSGRPAFSLQKKGKDVPLLIATFNPCIKAEPSNAWPASQEKEV